MRKSHNENGWNTNDEEQPFVGMERDRYIETDIGINSLFSTAIFRFHCAFDERFWARLTGTLDI